MAQAPRDDLFDPYAEPDSDPDALDIVDEATLTRRGALLIIALPLAASLVATAGCVRHEPACPILPRDEGQCRSRFCRYYRE